MAACPQLLYRSGCDNLGARPRQPYPEWALCPIRQIPSALFGLVEQGWLSKCNEYAVMPSGMRGGVTNTDSIDRHPTFGDIRDKRHQFIGMACDPDGEETLVPLALGAREIATVWDDDPRQHTPDV